MQVRKVGCIRPGIPTWTQGRRRTRTTTGGFTLVELLIVVVLLAVLAAVAFPVFVKAKESARTSECLSNMRQLGIALHMYIDEYDSRFPSAVPYGAPSFWKKYDSRTIQELLYPYVRNGMIIQKDGEEDIYTSPGIFACPCDMGPQSELGCGIKAGQPVWKSTGCSYQYLASSQEDWLCSDVAVPWTALSPLLDDGSTQVRVGAPSSALVSTVKKAVLIDLCYWHMGDKNPDCTLAYANTLFADGHAARCIGITHLEARIQSLKYWHSCTEIPKEQIETEAD